MKRFISFALSAAILFSSVILSVSAFGDVNCLPSDKELSLMQANMTLAVNDSENSIEEYIKLHQSEQSLLWGLDDPSIPDYQKILIVETRLAKLCQYDLDAPEKGQYAGNALVDRLAVCAGYSNAFKYLMNKLNIRCTGIIGSDFNHEWNIFELDGKTYFADLANDDGVSVGSHHFKYQFMSGYTFSKALRSMYNGDIEQYMYLPVTERLEKLREDAEKLLRLYTSYSDFDYPTEDYINEDVGQPWELKNANDCVDGFVLCGGNVYYGYYDSTLPTDADNVFIYRLGSPNPIFSYNKKSFAAPGSGSQNQLESDGKLLYLTNGIDVFTLDPTMSEPSLKALDKSPELSRILADDSGVFRIYSLRYFNGSMLCQVCEASDKRKAVYEGSVNTLPDYEIPLEIYYTQQEYSNSQDLYLLQYAPLSNEYKFTVSHGGKTQIQTSACQFIKLHLTDSGVYDFSSGNGKSLHMTFSISKINFYTPDGKCEKTALVRDSSAVEPITITNIPDDKVFLGWSRTPNDTNAEYYKIISDNDEGKIIPQSTGVIDLYPVICDKIGSYRLTPSITASYNKDTNGKVTVTVTSDNTIPMAFISNYPFIADATKLIIGTGTRIIGQNAFIGMTKAETIKLPETLERIDEAAFAVSIFLKEVTLPDSLNYIDGTAFSASPSATIYYNGSRDKLNSIVYNVPGITPSGIGSISTSPNVYCLNFCDSKLTGEIGYYEYTNLAGQSKGITYFDYIPGDCDMDGKVTLADVIIMKRALLGSAAGMYSENNTDINHDGKITISDVHLIKRIILGSELN